MIRFSIDEDPISKQASEHGRGVTYTPAKTRSYETRVRNACKDWMRRHGLQPLAVPVIVELTFRFEVPKSYSKKLTAALLAGDEAYTGRRDLDNMVKAAWDAMKKVIMADDRLVQRLTASKVAAPSTGIDVMMETYAEARARERQRQEHLGRGPRNLNASRKPGRGWGEYWLVEGTPFDPFPKLGDPEDR